jgi:uncharacterized protein YgbK (DUF1537 family)
MNKTLRVAPHLRKTTPSLKGKHRRPDQPKLGFKKTCTKPIINSFIFMKVPIIDKHHEKGKMKIRQLLVNKIFIIAFLRSVKAGKEFMFRSAAAVPKVLGGVSDKPLLIKEELITSGNPNGGIVLIGSHVNKTTVQLEALKNCKYAIEFIEFNAHLVKEDGGLKQEIERVVKLVENCIKSGKTVAVYTSRQLVQLETTDKDKILETSVKVSDAVTSIIGFLTVKPAFIIAKGGITSSDVGTKALKVKKANVMGQIKQGIPVWMTGPESKFPGMPYVIFPGNVGEVITLKETVEVLIG